MRSHQFWSILSRLCWAVALALRDRDFSLSSDLVLAFIQLLITCLSFWFFFFSFSLFSKLVAMCVVMKGEIEDRSVRGPVDGRSLVWWVIDNVVWTYSWLSIAGKGCSLIFVGAGEERARKVLALWGLRGLERQVDSARWTRWPNGVSADRIVSRKARRSHGHDPVQGSGSRPESVLGVCGGLPQNRQIPWLSHKTKNWGLAGGDGIRARREASMSRDTRRYHKACIGRTHNAVKAWTPDEECLLLDKSAPEGCVSPFKF
jgi:hypothetical protein